MGQSHEIQKQLQGARVAILATDGVERSELVEPRKALIEAGAHVEIVSIKSGTLQAWNHDEPADSIEIDHELGQVDAEDFDALVLPGGVMNPDNLRANEKAVEFVSRFMNENKPIAAICHGPWTLIETGALRGRKMTSWPSLKTDLRNAGVIWGDESVVRDGNLVTSRKPDDLPDFNRETIALIAARETLAQNASGRTVKKETAKGAAPSAQI